MPLFYIHVREREEFVEGTDGVELSSWAGARSTVPGRALVARRD